MSLQPLRNRLVVVAAIALISVPLMGCWWLAQDYLIQINDDGQSDVPPTAQADAPAPYYDADDDAGAPDGERAAASIFDNQNILAVYNGGTSPTFEVPSTVTVTQITTYHWNDASGNGSTGTISLKADDGKVYGPWETVGREGQGGVPNAYWTASPNVTLPAGSYTVIDSDPSTWSQNEDSGGEGFVSVLAESVP